MQQPRGFLRIYLGAAAGVGKTYQMLGDARLAAEEGTDIVIGYLEPHGRVATEERARGLERAPVVHYRSGSRAETEPGVDWLIERRPSVAIVDELAHTNPPGAPRPTPHPAGPPPAQALDRRRHAAGTGHRRLDDCQHPAPREPRQPHPLADRRRGA